MICLRLRHHRVIYCLFLIRDFSVKSPLSVAGFTSGTVGQTSSSSNASLNGGYLTQDLMDIDFIQLHNISVDIYQTFKADVDRLFSCNISIQEQSFYISVT